MIDGQRDGKKTVKNSEMPGHIHILGTLQRGNVL